MPVTLFFMFGFLLVTFFFLGCGFLLFFGCRCCKDFFFRVRKVFTKTNKKKQMIHCGLMYDILRMLCDSFSPQDIELVYTILKRKNKNVCTLKKNLPAALWAPARKFPKCFFFFFFNFCWLTVFGC